MLDGKKYDILLLDHMMPDPDGVETLKMIREKGNKIPAIALTANYVPGGEDYYLSKGRDIDIIHLNGSIEIAPILGLSDVIVDIVETGKTLQENDLRVIEDITDISARLISNKSSYKFKNELIDSLVNKLSEIVKEN